MSNVVDIRRLKVKHWAVFKQRVREHKRVLRHNTDRIILHKFPRTKLPRVRSYIFVAKPKLMYKYSYIFPNIQRSFVKHFPILEVQFFFFIFLNTNLPLKRLYNHYSFLHSRTAPQPTISRRPPDCLHMFYLPISRFVYM